MKQSDKEALIALMNEVLECSGVTKCGKECRKDTNKPCTLCTNVKKENEEQEYT